MVAPSGAGVLVGWPEEGFNLGIAEAGQNHPGGLLRQDRQYPGDKVQVLGVLVGDVGEERVDCCEPGFMGPDAVSPLVSMYCRNPVMAPAWRS